MAIPTNLDIRAVFYNGTDIPLVGGIPETQEKSVTPSESSQEVTPDSGKYLSKVTIGAISSSYVGSGVTRQGATTYNTSSSDQTIASGRYLSGTQTIRGVTTSGIDATKILSGTNIKVGDSASPGRVVNVNGSYVPFLQFTNVTVPASAWSSNSSYQGYSYRASVQCSNATSAMFPYVEFGEDDADGSNFAVYADSYNGGVYIYAKTIPSSAMTLKKIRFYKET